MTGVDVTLGSLTKRRLFDQDHGVGRTIVTVSGSFRKTLTTCNLYPPAFSVDYG